MSLKHLLPRMVTVMLWMCWLLLDTTTTTLAWQQRQPTPPSQSLLLLSSSGRGGDRGSRGRRGSSSDHIQEPHVQHCLPRLYGSIDSDFNYNNGGHHQSWLLPTTPRLTLIPFLREFLQLPEKDLTNIIIRYPNLLSLRVDRNIKPTMDFLLQYGFSKEQISALLAFNPAILSFNHQTTLPNKLQSLQDLFGLSKEEVFQVIRKVPVALTASIERNEEIADFFLHEVGMSKSELRHVVLSRNVLCIPLVTLERCYSLLRVNYCYRKEEIKELFVKHPIAINAGMLDNLDLRFRFFRKALGLRMPPERDFCEFTKKCPYALFLHPKERLGQCFMNLQEEFQMDDFQLATFITKHPALLSYNPEFLANRARELIRFLCTFGEDVPSKVASQSPFPDASKSLLQVLQDQHKKKEVDVIKEETSLPISGFVLEDSPYFQVEEIDWNCYEEEKGKEYDANIIANDVSLLVDSKQLDILRHCLKSCQDHEVLSHLYRDNVELTGEMSDQLLNYHYELTANLNLPHDKALQLVEQNPRLISFTIQRYRLVLTAISFTLGMTKHELARVVAGYPRILAMSLDGKIKDVIEFMGKLALQYLERQTNLSTTFAFYDMINEKEEKTQEDKKKRGRKAIQLFEESATKYAIVNPMQSQELNTIIAKRRDHPIRTMIREFVLQYPLLIGSSISRIEERSDVFFRNNLPWKELLSLIQRNQKQIERWHELNHAKKLAMLEAFLKEIHFPVQDSSPRGDFGNDFSTYCRILIHLAPHKLNELEACMSKKNRKDPIAFFKDAVQLLTENKEEQSNYLCAIQGMDRLRRLLGKPFPTISS